MRTSIVLVASAALVRAHAADLYFPSIPEDPFAFPKFRVAFLNGLAVANSTAERWLADGLSGGEAQFLEQHASPAGASATSTVTEPTSAAATIASGSDDVAHDADVALPVASPLAQEAKLQLMRIGPKASYLCLIPPTPLETQEPQQHTSENSARSPAASWELLQPMSQGCLYYTLGWFTYAYCHGKYVKQFREAPHAHPHPPGGRIPQEDPEWESYYLGIAPSPETLPASPPPIPASTGNDAQVPLNQPPSSSSSLSSSSQTTDLTPIESLAALSHVELARGAGQRYLIQRWDDGTPCDKTGIPRKIEVQFHCGMTTPDKIFLIKETSVCQYVLVIHTPRLCGEPGFKSERASMEESVLKCREVVDDAEWEKEVSTRAIDPSQVKTALSSGKLKLKDEEGKKATGGGRVIPYVEAMHPFKFTPPPGLMALRPPTAPKDAAASVKDKKGAAGKVESTESMIKNAIKALLQGSGLKTGTEDGREIEVIVEDLSELSGETQPSAAQDAKGGSQLHDLLGDGFDPSDIVTVQSEDGSTQYLILDTMDADAELGEGEHEFELYDTDAADFEALLDGTTGGGNAGQGDADGNKKRLDAIRRRLLESLQKTAGGARSAAAGHGGRTEDEEEEESVPTQDSL